MKQPDQPLEHFLKQPPPKLPPEDFARLASERTINVCGRDETVTLRRDELLHCYLPIAQALIEAQAERSDSRLLAGVAGCPGAGKSVFALLLADVTNALLKNTPKRRAAAAVWPFDGVHHTNAYLESHLVPGTKINLIKRKGRPETFDVEAAIRICTQLRSLSDEFFLPAYNRRTHNPVEGQIRVTRDDLIVIVEGNFLFMTAGETWQRLSRLFDIRIFLHAGRDECRDGLIRRHVRGGRSHQDAIGHYETVDLPNTLLVEQTAAAADIVVERTSGRIRCGPSQTPRTGSTQ